MSNVFTLDDLNQAIENKYAPLVFQAGDQEFTLVSLLRVDKKVRKAVQMKLDTLTQDADADDEVGEDETVAAFEFVLKSVTKNGQGNALVRLLGGDLLKLSELMKQWQKVTQPGEASSSQN